MSARFEIDCRVSTKVLFRHYSERFRNNFGDIKKMEEIHLKTFKLQQSLDR